MKTAMRKRKRGRGVNTADAARHICEDILVDILSRLPARSAIRCTALSKRHQKLIATSKFWDARCRLAGAPLPPPHVAYLATVWPDDRTHHRGSVEVFPRPHSAFHDFRLTGEGLGSAGLRRWIFQDAGVTERYVGTCNGVVLLAARAVLRAVLFNPAVAHSEREVFFPCPERKTRSSRYRISGIGYGPSRGIYKLVVTRQEKLADLPNRGKEFHTTELLVCTLGSAGDRLRKVSLGLKARIRGASLYMDGKVYLLDVQTSAVLALDVDGETVSSITLPGARVKGAAAAAHAVSGLMEVSGRVWVATADGASCTALWLLTPEHRWERRFMCERTLPRLAGAWDCGGAALLLMSTRGNGTVLFLIDGSNDTVLEGALPSALRLDKPDYALCWGYRPTLVSTRSVIGARSRVRQCRGGLYAVVEPVIELHKERARERTVHVNSVMDLLLQIIGTLPQEREDVIKQLGLQMSSRFSVSLAG